jgi:hypothetical protein
MLPAWVNEYTTWCKTQYAEYCRRQGVEYDENYRPMPRGIEYRHDTKVGGPVFLVSNGYQMHWRSSENMDAMIGHFRSCIPREKGFSLYFGKPEAALDDMLRITAGAGSFARDYEDQKFPSKPGDTVKVLARGELTPEQAEKMGCVLACMLGDASFWYTAILPSPNAKFQKLQELIKPLA